MSTNAMVWLVAYCFPYHIQRLDDWMIHWLQLEQVTSKQVWTRSSARETSNLAAKHICREEVRYNGHGWNMVKKKTALKVGWSQAMKHRRYNLPSNTGSLLEKRLQLNKSWTDRLKRPVLCRVSTYPTGDRIFWTYQQISVSTVDSISQIHNSTISLSTCTFNTKTLLRYRETWPLMLHDSKSRESNKPQKS